MTRIFVTTIILYITVSDAVLSQNAVKIRLLAGPNLTWGVNDLEGFSTESRVGFSAGLAVERVEKLGWSIQMLYSYCRTYYKIQSFMSEYNSYLRQTGTQKISFIDAPILMYLTLSDGLTAKAGFETSVALSAKTNGKFLATGSSPNSAFGYGDDFSLENKHSFATWHESVIFGISFTVWKGLDFELRYGYGLTNSTKNDLEFLKAKRASLTFLFSKSI